jgi:hypothetical protein
MPRILPDRARSGDEAKRRSADVQSMTRLRAHLVAVVLATTATAATGAFLALARPQYHAPQDRRIDLSSGPQNTTTGVERTFAAHGIRLRRTGGMPGAVMFTDVHPASKLDDAFLVTVWRPTAKLFDDGDSGPKPLYEQWVGNVNVFYGGRDHAFAARIAAAADDLAG